MENTTMKPYAPPPEKSTEFTAPTELKFKRIYSQSWLITIVGLFLVIAVISIMYYLMNVLPTSTPITPTPAPTISTKSCVRAGCSNQLCVSSDVAPDIITTCEYKNEYACYDNATCEVQSSGDCGWTMTTELQTCLNQTQ